MTILTAHPDDFVPVAVRSAGDSDQFGQHGDDAASGCLPGRELASVGKRVELMIRTRPMLPDPNDEMVLETAINGRADAIVTFNDRDFRPVAARFRCSVVRPGVVIRGLAEESK
jgi:hypothetical protein